MYVSFDHKDHGKKGLVEVVLWSMVIDRCAARGIDD